MLCILGTVRSLVSSSSDRLVPSPPDLAALFHVSFRHRRAGVGTPLWYASVTPVLRGDSHLHVHVNTGLAATEPSLPGDTGGYSSREPLLNIVIDSSIKNLVPRVFLFKDAKSFSE